MNIEVVNKRIDYLKYLTIISIIIGIISGGLALRPYFLKDVSGAWDINFKTVTSSYRRYIGMVVMYRININQDAEKISGSGESMTCNGNYVNPKARIHIDINGTLDGNKIELTFHITNPNSRNSDGSSHMTLEGKNTITGSFIGDAANTVGTVTGSKD